MRPAYHFAPAANWLSDPNGLVHHQGEWHMFYQYNPKGEDWGHMAWGHAVSRDLVEWTERVPALIEDERHMIFSGSAVIDTRDSAGFGAGAMVAIYTGAVVGEQAHQSQCLAFSRDDGRSWTKFHGNPVLDLGLADFRDPNVFWHESSGRWIMTVVLSAENTAVLFGSDNLRDWTELSRIGPWDAPGAIWECPLLIELPIEGSDASRWLFKVDVLDGGPGSGAIYRTGRFDGHVFVPDGEAWQIADHGRDFYAAIAWHAPRDSAGRPLWIGWMGNHAYQAKLPRKGWRGAMSLPRRLSLRSRQGMFELVQQPEPAAVSGTRPIALDQTSCAPSGRIALPGQSGWRLTIADNHQRQLELVRTNSEVRLSRRDPGSPFLDTVIAAPVSHGVELAGWLDGRSLEVLSADGTLSLTVQHQLDGQRHALHFALAD